MEYKYLPKDLATRLTEVTADVLSDAWWAGCEGSGERAGKGQAVDSALFIIMEQDTPSIAVRLRWGGSQKRQNNTYVR